MRRTGLDNKGLYRATSLFFYLFIIACLYRLAGLTINGIISRLDVGAFYFILREFRHNLFLLER